MLDVIEQLDGSLPFQVGALYNRQTDVHARFSGQERGGISTPRDAPLIFVFTGEAGKAHGYSDFWADDGIFHYFGEGQKGDMEMKGGNLAIRDHLQSGKRLLLFKSMGKSKPYRYDGEFVCRSWYWRPDTPATKGANRKAIVFRLEPLDESSIASHVHNPTPLELELGSTVALKLTEVRSKQELFRRRLIGVEKQCRLTRVMDLRFLRASHIKPWSACNSGDERVDGHNGLLLTPHADLLFDRGWITFEKDGRLIVSDQLPSDVRAGLRLDLKPGRKCGEFSPEQQAYLGYHQNQVYERRFKSATSPLADLVNDLSAVG